MTAYVMTCGYRPERHPWWRCLLEAGHWGWHRPVRDPNVTRKPCGCTTLGEQFWPCEEHTPLPPTPAAPSTVDRALPPKRRWMQPNRARRIHRKKEPKPL